MPHLFSALRLRDITWIRQAADHLGQHLPYPARHSRVFG